MRLWISITVETLDEALSYREPKDITLFQTAITEIFCILRRGEYLFPFNSLGFMLYATYKITIAIYIDNFRLRCEKYCGAFRGFGGYWTGAEVEHIYLLYN